MEREVSVAIEYEIAAHLRDVQLFRTPELTSENQAHVTPDHARRRDRIETLALKTQAGIAGSTRIGKPDIWMPKMSSEALELVRTRERDHHHSSMQPGYLLVELPQLREMLLAEESTEVAQQDQDRRTPQQLTRREDGAVDRQEVEVEVDAHRIIMRLRLT